MSSFDTAQAWRLHPQVAVRAEHFGALLYHFGTRQLSFVKDRVLLDVVKTLGDHDSARQACLAAGVDDAQLPRFERGLGQLAASNMLVPQEGTR